MYNNYYILNLLNISDKMKQMLNLFNKNIKYIENI